MSNCTESTAEQGELRKVKWRREYWRNQGRIFKRDQNIGLDVKGNHYVDCFNSHKWMTLCLKKHTEVFGVIYFIKSKSINHIPLPIKFYLFFKKKFTLALADVVQWIECWPKNRRVTSSIPSQGTCLGCRQVPGWGHVRGNLLMYINHNDVSLPPFLPPFPSL